VALATHFVGICSLSLNPARGPSSLGGSVSEVWWVLAALINGTLYAAIGPAFWRLMKNIKESAVS
jgi:hypothetical protein